VKIEKRMDKSSGGKNNVRYEREEHVQNVEICILHLFVIIFQLLTLKRDVTKLNGCRHLNR